MARSLQEQLLSAGLVNKKKATQLEQEKRKQAKQKPRGAKGQASPPAAGRDPQQADKAARDRELNLERQQEAERKALTAQVEQLINAHRISTAGADLDFRFVDRGVIKTVAVNPSQHGALVHGTLALVRYRRVYALVPKDIGGKIAERDAGAVVVLNAGLATDAVEDVEYADYKVPDDLMW